MQIYTDFLYIFIDFYLFYLLTLESIGFVSTEDED